LPLPLPPPPLDETRRLEVRLSLGPPAELGLELEAATAFLEEEDGLYLEELFGLSESPRVCLVKGPSSEFLDLERSRGEQVVVGCLREKASTAPGTLSRVVSFPAVLSRLSMEGPVLNPGLVVVCCLVRELEPELEPI